MTRTTKVKSAARSSKSMPRSRPSAPLARPQTKSANSHKGKVNSNDACFKNMEFVMELKGNADQTFSNGLISLPINPALDIVFPWLSAIAAQYEHYLFRSISFSYEPSCAATSSGQVVFAFDTDPEDPAPSTLREMMCYAGAAKTNLWQPITFSLNQFLSRRQRGVLNTRVGAIPNTDIKTYDLGNLFIRVSGLTSTDTVGTLRVAYEVVLDTAQPVSVVQSTSLLPQTRNLSEDLKAVATEVSTAAIQNAVEELAAASPIQIPNLRAGILDLTAGYRSRVVTLMSGTTASDFGLTFEHDWEGVVSFSYSGGFIRASNVASTWNITVCNPKDDQGLPVLVSPQSADYVELSGQLQATGYYYGDMASEIFPLTKPSSDTTVWVHAENFQNILPGNHVNGAAGTNSMVGYYGGLTPDVTTVAVLQNGNGAGTSNHGIYSFMGLCRVHIRAHAGDFFCPAFNFTANYSSGAALSECYATLYWCNARGLSLGFYPLYTGDEYAQTDEIEPSVSKPMRLGGPRDPQPIPAVSDKNVCTEASLCPLRQQALDAQREKDLAILDDECSMRTERYAAYERLKNGGK